MFVYSLFFFLLPFVCFVIGKSAREYIRNRGSTAPLHVWAVDNRGTLGDATDASRLLCGTVNKAGGRGTCDS